MTEDTDQTATPLVAIRAAETAADLGVARLLFQAYAESLDFSLDFQGFEYELDNLPGRYATASSGAMLLGLVDGRPPGVVGLRDLGYRKSPRLNPSHSTVYRMPSSSSIQTINN